MSHNYKTPQFIRPLAICVFRYNGKILVCEGKDSVKNEIFYRPAGGMIEFGEKAEDALKREIMEETGEPIRNIKFIGTLENIFTYEGRPGHEIIMVYDAEFVNETVYSKDVIQISESIDAWCHAYWKSIDEFSGGNLILYPDGLKNLLKDSSSF